MKTYRLLAFGLAMAAATSSAQSPEHASLISGRSPDRKQVVDLAKMKRNYLACLQSRNPGVVESALGHAILLRIAYPKEDMRDIEVLLINLATRGGTKAVRYRAYVAIQVFADPLAFGDAVNVPNAGGEEFFKALASRLESKM